MDIKKTEINLNLESYKHEGYFVEVSIDLLIEAGSYITLLVNLYDDNKLIWNEDQAVIGGNLVRLYKLICGVLDNVCDQKGEFVQIFTRLAFECIVNTRYLINNYNEKTIISYKLNSLKTDKRLYTEIKSCIAERDNIVLPIEQRMMSSIEKLFAKSNIELNIDHKTERNWGNKNFFEKTKSLGLDKLYLSHFSLTSNEIHGSWSDLMFHHLETNSDGNFVPNFDWETPRPQPLTAIAFLVPTLLIEYLETFFDDIPIELFTKIKGLENRILLFMELHEEWLKKSP
jgi:hypothetical protein